MMIKAFLGARRLKPYLDAGGGDIQRASDLYQWNMKLGGALHTQISYVEIAVRNSIDEALANWNSIQPRPDGSGSFGREWTAQDGAAQPLYSLIKNHVKLARAHAKKEAESRHHTHPRHNVVPTHDDVVAQLMFGNWTALFTDNDVTRRTKLWEDALRVAFPNADQTDFGRNKIAKQLESLRRLRNKAAHHDNVLSVAVAKRLNDMLSLLRSINADYPTWAMADSSLRRIAKEDPRLSWTP
jgi:hypothetical protein